MRRIAFARSAAAAAFALLLLIATTGPALALLDLWSISAAPKTLTAHQETRIELTVTNEGIALDNPIGCVRITVPDRFEVSDAGVVSSPAGTSWKGSVSGASGSSHVVEFRAEADDDVLEGGLLAKGTGVFSVDVVGLEPGTWSWPARAWSQRNCSGGAFAAKSLSIAVKSPASTPTPPPTATPTATPSGTPTPTAGATPTPTRPATPIPTRPPTPAPSASPSPTPGRTAPPVADPGETGHPTTSPRASRSPEAPGAGPTAPTSGGGGSSGGAPGAGPDGTVDRAETDVLRLDRRAGNADLPAADLALAAMGEFGPLIWAVPGLVLAVPGLVLILAVIAQVVGGAIWLPVVRRRVGSFGIARARAR